MVYIFLADGFEEIEAVVTIDILRRAGIDVQTVSIKDSPDVAGAHMITVKADITADKIIKQNLEMIILPGGVPGTNNLQNSEKVQEILRYASENEKILAAICAAPSVLGKAGFLKGKNAVCFPGYEEDLLGANVKKIPVAIDEKVITSRGAGTAHLFAFEIVSLLKGNEIAEKLKKGMLYE